MEPNPEQQRSLYTIINVYQAIGWNYIFWFVEFRGNLLKDATILELRPEEQSSQYVKFVIFDDGETLMYEEEES